MNNLKQEIQALEQNREDLIIALDNKGVDVEESYSLRHIINAINNTGSFIPNTFITLDDYIAIEDKRGIYFVIYD